MSDAFIRFLTDPPLLGLIPQPYPATHAVADWFKQTGGANEGRRTVKQCPPFLEAMTAGYIIPAVCDMQLSISADGKLDCRWDNRFGKVLDLHHPADYQGTPFADRHVVKLTNPWTIQTPQGYSTLFVAPLNNSFDTPLRVLSGVVETDRYYVRVNLPAVVTLRVGATAVIKQGTPLAQLIPFRREEWKMETGVVDGSEAAKFAPHIGPRGEVESGFYRKNCQVKKTYK